MRPTASILGLSGALICLVLIASAAKSAEAADCADRSVFKDVADIVSLAKCEARDHGLPDYLVETVIEIESNFSIQARGADGEVGLMQVMPATARMLGFEGTLTGLADPKTNVRLGTRYLAGAYRLAKGDLCTTLMKYRAGHGERRFSYLSVAYCRKARQIMKREGIAVTGSLPKATFGFARAGGKVGKSRVSSSGGGICVKRSFVPGPGYGRCLVRSSKSRARKVAAMRRKIFE